MNYIKVYNKIIEKCKNIKPTKSSEKHHIVPKSLGGSNDSYNLVELEHKEHFICHLLLAKIYGGPMIVAAFLMSQNKKYNSKEYSLLREKNSELSRKRFKGIPKSAEHNRKNSEANRNKIVSNETKNKSVYQEKVENGFIIQQQS